MRRVDRRMTLISLVVLGVASGGFAIDRYGAPKPAPQSVTVPDGSPLGGDETAQLAHQYFQQSVVMLQTRNYEYAVASLHEVLKIYPQLPEAHANMGYALIGLGRHEAAADFFRTATDLRPTLHTAYYGLAIAEEGRGDLLAALASMQAYAHLAASDDPYLDRAQSAMRAWESDLSERSP